MKPSLTSPIHAIALAVVIGGAMVTTVPTRAAVKTTVRQRVTRKQPVKPSAAQIAAGRGVFATSGCQGCHKLGGQGGDSGPDLSHGGRNRSAGYIAGKLADPKATNKDSIMPKFKGSSQDESALVAFLSSLK
jgi:cbb3-type cytochrome oxidase cytochrome c subunit